MKPPILVFLIGVSVLGIAAIGFFLVFAGFHHMLPNSTPAWGMNHHMGAMHGQGGMMHGWVQSLHNTCMAWMHGSDGDQNQTSAPENQAPSVSDSAGADRERTASQEERVFELETTIQGGFAYRGLNDSIQKQINPVLMVETGEDVTIQVENGDGVAHDLVIPALSLRTKLLSRRGARATLRFTPDQEGTYIYYCSVPGHRAAGMEGQIIVGS